MELNDMYDQLVEVINEIDVKLDSLSGGKGATKTKVLNGLVTAHADKWEGAVNDMIAQLETLDEASQAAVYTGFVNKLRKTFDKSVNSYVEGLVDSQPVQEALITPEEAEVLSKKRSEVYQKVKSVVELADTFGESFEMPKIRRGSSGKRGPRNLSLFTFFVDGVEQEEASIGEIAKANGYDKAAELTDALRKSGFDTKDGDAFDNFTMPNGKTLMGYRDDAEDDETEEVEDISSDGEDTDV